MYNLKIYTLDELLNIDDINQLCEIHKYYYDFNLNLIFRYKDDYFSSLDILDFKNKYFLDYSNIKKTLPSIFISYIITLQVVAYTHFTLLNTVDTKSLYLFKGGFNK